MPLSDLGVMDENASLRFTQRPDGAEIAWYETGEGPLIVLANQFFGLWSTFEDLLGNLAVDHRVVRYFLRGTGESTRAGPYDLETDAEDLAAVIESTGQPALILAFADGCNRAVRVAARRPELLTAVVSPAGNPVGTRALRNTDALAASEGVLQALVGMMTTDYRGALRTMVATANPDWDEERVRQRIAETVEVCPQEAALPRLKSWIADDATEHARALGDRLWLLEDGTNQWFTLEVARQTQAILPEAHVLEVEDGAISRPDITAGVIRGITAEPAQVGSQGREQAL
jgi:pimeloyl-ACP methyl ester carboxylesterase